MRDIATLQRAFSFHADYMQDTRLGMEQVNFADRGLQLTRSFRALKVWMSVQTFGMAAFRQAVTRGIELADQAGDYVRNSEYLQLLSAPSLGILCFRYRPRDCTLPTAALDSLNERIQARIIESGTAMLSSTRLRGAYSLRFCIMSHQTRWQDVSDVLRAIEALGREFQSA